jgi:hypothetical protein
MTENNKGKLYYTVKTLETGVRNKLSAVSGQRSAKEKRLKSEKKGKAISYQWSAVSKRQETAKLFSSEFCLLRPGFYMTALMFLCICNWIANSENSITDKQISL